MKQQITAYVYARKDWDDKPQFTLLGFDDAGANFGHVVHSQKIEFDEPSEDQMVAAELAALREQERAALAKFLETQKHIHDRIAKLTALTQEVAA